MSGILVISKSSSEFNSIKEALFPTIQPIKWYDGKDLKSYLRQNHYDIILLHFTMERKEGIRLLRQIKGGSPHTPFLVLSEIEDASLIVEVIREGAFDFLVRPFSDEKIRLTVQKALESKHLRDEIDYLRHEQDIIYDFDRIIANSHAMTLAIEQLKKFSQADSTLLITGETGTGKSFLSGAVHFNSNRRNKPFIKINCANIPESLLESELFGHEKGAFTGANRTRVGRLEQGRDGTVFLDEIGEMSPALQAKLLRVLEEKSFERVGGNKTIYCDIRVIAATNRDPEKQVEDGKFREDLYYRINVLRLHLPPLRERYECIQPLAYFLLDKNCRSLRKKIKDFSPELLEAFKSYSWPGNIRQLANVIERAVILEESDIIRTESVVLPDSQIRITQGAPRKTDRPKRSIKDQEKRAVLKALEESLWVQKDAAKLLDISPRALNYKIGKFGITHPRWRKNR